MPERQRERDRERETESKLHIRIAVYLRMVLDFVHELAERDNGQFTAHKRSHALDNLQKAGFFCAPSIHQFQGEEAAATATRTIE